MSSSEHQMTYWLFRRDGFRSCGFFFIREIIKMDDTTNTDRVKSEVDEDRDADQPVDEKSEVGGMEPLLNAKLPAQFLVCSRRNSGKIDARGLAFVPVVEDWPI